MTVYVFLLYGRSPAAERELVYALETLREEFPSLRAQPGRPAAAPSASYSGQDEESSLLPLRDRVRGKGPSEDDPAATERVVLYTDRPGEFPGVATLDARPLLAEVGEYRHGVKPRVLADALRRFGEDCVMLDLDGFVRPGFAREIADALAKGAAMNQFVRRPAYPDFGLFETQLPHLGPYRLDRENAAMLNSGLVAVRAEHAPLIEDAVVLMDRLWATGLHRHDIEQFALAETLRVGGVAIALIDDKFEHYCARWSRRYMRRALRRRAPGARVPYGKGRVRWFKAAWTLRLAMRKARSI